MTGQEYIKPAPRLQVSRLLSCNPSARVSHGNIGNFNRAVIRAVVENAGGVTNLYLKGFSAVIPQ